MKNVWWKMRYLLFIMLLMPILVVAVTGEMLPYLQTPTPTSMYVCWIASSSNQSIVQYGTTQTLGTSVSGDVYLFDQQVKWHWVKLQNLQPNTRYYYKCITAAQVSAVNSFTTAPTNHTPDGHLRVIFLGDSQYEPGPVVTNVSGVVSAIQSKLFELYGAEWRQKINLICHSGDIVDWAGIPDTFLEQYFEPFSPLTSFIPSMIARGNHDGDSYLYDFLKTEEIAGTEGEGYYSFDLVNSRFIFMDSNLKGSAQLNWIESKLNQAETNNDIDFVFGIIHHFGHSELAPSAYPEPAWVQNDVIPRFGSLSKPTFLTFGHAHGYERGTDPQNRVRLICNGGGGADIDRWGVEIPHDYPEIHKAMDYWEYMLVDIDLVTHTYVASTYSIGNSDHPLNNMLIDSWSQDTNLINYGASALSAGYCQNEKLQFTSAPDSVYGNFDLMSSQFQVSANSSFSSTPINVIRDWQNVYADTGSPSFTPIDFASGIDLKRYCLDPTSLTAGNTYFWRVRYRSQNADWGEWSVPQTFVNQASPPSADFAETQVLEVNKPIQFTDTSIGETKAWNWIFTPTGNIDSTERDPIWTFSEPGIYRVELRVTINGQTYPVWKTLNITAPLQTPVDIRTQILNNHFKLMWEPVPLAASYNIYMSFHEYGPFTKITTISTNSYIDPTPMDTQRFFYVTAEKP